MVVAERPHAARLTQRLEASGLGNVIAKAEIDIDAPAEKVWKALTDADVIERYFFGSRVETDWRPGSEIKWKGEWQGRAYEDKGRVLEVEPNRLLKLTHFSPLSGVPDRPENYHTLVFTLAGRGDSTHVSLTQDNNKDETEAEHSTQNWRAMLGGLKKIVEEG